ncbi:hypothetical protein B296_00036690 [Ensete ventricosum]|uniref:Trichome birefringence-like C-terminal domain-containing protein n=1 Tax=Ensete ventricosum TaxID=4639 RepID=A0A426XB32_ENSVE|nr:hypothetical protein B296_00036690 [Ensete ventricosum]
MRKALSTWAKWVDTNVNREKSLVVFRGYSTSHFRYFPQLLERLKRSISIDLILCFLEAGGSGTPAGNYRKDAHPSIYRKQSLTDEERRDPEKYQDCSHWCLPGVPDSWNELLYAQLLIKQHQML